MTVSLIFQLALQLWGALFCLIIAVILYSSGEAGRGSAATLFYSLLADALLLTADASGTLLDGSTFWLLQLAVFLMLSMQMLMGVFLARYIFALMQEENTKPDPKLLQLVYVLSFVFEGLLLISLKYPFFYQITEENHFERLPGMRLGMLFIYLITLLAGLMVWTCPERKKLSRQTRVLVILLVFLPALAATGQEFLPALPLLNMSITVCLILLFIVYEQSRAERSRRQQEELQQLQIRVMMSQLRPHFLFNALTGIAGLPGNPPETRDAIVKFSRYLRGNMDAIGRDTLVPFEKELEHIRLYTWIEQLRFGNDLKIDYEIGCTDFVLPTLSVQILVENAIKHGVTEREELGCVTIATVRKEDAVEITVTDDGVGFDTKALEHPENEFIGLAGASRRLKLLIGADLTISSVIGEGTRARIRIPDKRKAPADPG